MKKYSVLLCFLLLCGCMTHRHPQQQPVSNPSADCSSHDDEIDCSWNVPDKV